MVPDRGPRGGERASPRAPPGSGCGLRDDGDPRGGSRSASGLPSRRDPARPPCSVATVARVARPAVDPADVDAWLAALAVNPDLDALLARLADNPELDALLADLAARTDPLGIVGIPDPSGPSPQTPHIG